MAAANAASRPLNDADIPSKSHRPSSTKDQQALPHAAITAAINGNQQHQHHRTGSSHSSSAATNKGQMQPEPAPATAAAALHPADPAAHYNTTNSNHSPEAAGGFGYDTYMAPPYFGRPDSSPPYPPGAEGDGGSAAAAIMAAAAAGMLHPQQAAAAAAAYGLAPQQQQQPLLGSAALPEAAPAPKTDPVELSLLTKYLEVVRQTQGEAAAAQAQAASGLPSGAAALAGGTSSSSQEVGDAATPSSSVPTGSTSSSGGAAYPASFSSEAAAGTLNNNQMPSSAATADNALAVNNLLGFIKQRKLAGVARQQHARRSSTGSVSSQTSSTSAAGGGGGSAAGGSAGGGGNVALGPGRKIWIQPSGPRRPGEGVENEEQGILSAEEVPTTGEVVMRITLLAAGFVIGPSGSSVREIVRLSGAEINSWTEATGSHRGRRPARIFLIKGEPSCVAQAVYVVTAAVDRYKELCEGRYSGQSVPRAQNVLGVTFSYQPPPKSIVPCAASLKELYAPPHTVAHSARYASSSPPGLYGPSSRSSRGSSAHHHHHHARGSPSDLASSAYPHGHNPYDRFDAAAAAAWPAAMMNAAAAMSFNPLQALAAAGGNPTAAAGFGGLAGLQPFGPPAGLLPPGAAGPGGMLGASGGFGAPLAPLGAAGPGAAGLDPSAMAALQGGMNPMHYGGMFAGAGGADMFGPSGNGMFGMLQCMGGPAPGAATAAGVGGEDVHHHASAGPEGAMDPAAAAAAGLTGYGSSPWCFPGLFDPSAMAALMAGAGMYAPLGAPGGFGGPDASAQGGPNSSNMYQHPMTSAAALAAGLDPSAAALAAMAPSAPPSVGVPEAAGGAQEADALQQQQHEGATLGTPREAAAAPPDMSATAAAEDTRDSHHAAAAASGPASADGDTPPRSPPPSHQLRMSGPSHGAPAAVGPWPGGLPPPSPFYRGPGSLPHLTIQTEHSFDGTPGSPAGRQGTSGFSPGLAFPPASPGAPLLGFGPLFHPMSPVAAHLGPLSHAFMGPLPGMPPFGPVPASPVRVMRDKSGHQVPYMEVGGTVYFAPASPMPPKPPLMPHGSGGPRTPQHQNLHHASDHATAAAQHGNGGSNAPAAAGESPGSSTAAAAASAPSGGCNGRNSSSGPNHSGSGGSVNGTRPRSSAGSGRSSAGNGGSGGPSSASKSAEGRPKSAMRLFEDNPYLAQDAIGSSPGAASAHPQHHQTASEEGSSNGSGSAGGSHPRTQGRTQDNQQQQQQHQGGNGGQQQQQQWQVKRTAGSSNSVAGPTSSVTAAADAPSGTPAAPPPPPRGPASSSQQVLLKPSPQKGSEKPLGQQQQLRDDAALSTDQSVATGGGGAGSGGLPPSGAFGGRSPSMTDVSDATAAAAVRGHVGELRLNAHDPIVSPGRITLASKVKAARLYNAASAGGAAGRPAEGNGTT